MRNSEGGEANETVRSAQSGSLQQWLPFLVLGKDVKLPG